MKRLWPLGLCLLLTGCGAPSPLSLLTMPLQGVSYLASGKSLYDHALSIVTRHKCASFNLMRGEPLCSDEPADYVNLAGNVAPHRGVVLNRQYEDDHLTYLEVADLPAEMRAYARPTQQQVAALDFYDPMAPDLADTAIAASEPKPAAAAAEAPAATGPIPALPTWQAAGQATGQVADTTQPSLSAIEPAAPALPRLPVAEQGLPVAAASPAPGQTPSPAASPTEERPARAAPVQEAQADIDDLLAPLTLPRVDLAQPWRLSLMAPVNGEAWPLLAAAEPQASTETVPQTAQADPVQLPAELSDLAPALEGVAVAAPASHRMAFVPVPKPRPAAVTVAQPSPESLADRARSLERLAAVLDSPAPRPARVAFAPPTSVKPAVVQTVAMQPVAVAASAIEPAPTHATEPPVPARKPLAIADTPAVASAAGPQRYLVIGSFSRSGNAARFAARHAGLNAQVLEAEVEGRTVHRVVVAYEHKAEAATRRQIATAGIAQAPWALSM